VVVVRNAGLFSPFPPVLQEAVPGGVDGDVVVAGQRSVHVEHRDLHGLLQGRPGYREMMHQDQRNIDRNPPV
jgi:hypothetical protein